MKIFGAGANVINCLFSFAYIPQSVIKSTQIKTRQAGIFWLQSGSGYNSEMARYT